MMQQLLRARVDSLEIPQFTFGPNHAFPSFVKRIGKDSVDVNLGVPSYAKIDKAGRLLGVSARASTVKTETVRVRSLDFDGLVSGWVAAENRGEIPGAVSARDTTRSGPFRRGRVPRSSSTNRSGSGGHNTTRRRTLSAFR
jgi:hypothetical protein